MGTIAHSLFFEMYVTTGSLNMDGNICHRQAGDFHKVYMEANSKNDSITRKIEMKLLPFESLSVYYFLLPFVFITLEIEKVVYLEVANTFAFLVTIIM